MVNPPDITMMLFGTKLFIAASSFLEEKVVCSLKTLNLCNLIVEELSQDILVKFSFGLQLITAQECTKMHTQPQVTNVLIRRKEYKVVHPCISS